MLSLQKLVGHVVVIGAGTAGLAAAQHLYKHGVDVCMHTLTLYVITHVCHVTFYRRAGLILAAYVDRRQP